MQLQSLMQTRGSRMRPIRAARRIIGDARRHAACGAISCGRRRRGRLRSSSRKGVRGQEYGSSSRASSADAAACRSGTRYRSPQLEDAVPGSTLEIANQMYLALRGANNLVFPNSRRQVELYADLLRRACEREGHPNEFWPHHGSLSKELREDAEHALRSGDRPATAVCTSRWNWASTSARSRASRKWGRRRRSRALHAATRTLGTEAGTSRRSCAATAWRRKFTRIPVSSDRIREGLVQSIADAFSCCRRSWVEPPRAAGLHASTFVQQVMSR